VDAKYSILLSYDGNYQLGKQVADLGFKPTIVIVYALTLVLEIGNATFIII
tara:strand:- start:319 stop:471 length:153 start_codon:yes stop_codon:yes gene_type:complete